MLGAVNIFKVLQEYWTWGKPLKGHKNEIILGYPLRWPKNDSEEPF